MFESSVFENNYKKKLSAAFKNFDRKKEDSSGEFNHLIGIINEICVADAIYCMAKILAI